ncbi:MAG: aminotransferase class I/II-fold pyridoxal phosphate-dependent enzyme [Desulfobacteraceae bacterium]|nr:aminotransferase class I/II-fold pyridoxal phosphate-dependent enzyme [Desulfobacteraceae bacterium]
MATKKNRFSEETNIVHGIDNSHISTQDLVAPIHMTSTFKFNDFDQGAGVFDGSRQGYVYTRIANPTVDLLQEKMALLEGGEAAIATASGMAAIAAVTMTLAGPGDNFVACNSVYGGTFALFKDHLRKFNISPRFVSPVKTNTIDRVASLMDADTRFLFIETPANPTLSIINIELWATLADQHRIPLVVDNTFASPYLQKPLDMGAHLVIHSATKYLGGHGDIIAGMVIGDGAMIQRIRTEYMDHFGPAVSPFNAWLILRGLKTLAIRMDRHSSTALKVAMWLENHPKVSQVYYPGLGSHPDHLLAQKQMKQFSGILGFELKGGRAAARTLLNRVELCTLAVSLGDCDTLIQHPASMTHSTYSEADLRAAGIDQGLVRLSLGLEHPDDIMDDLETALAAIDD